MLFAIVDVALLLHLLGIIQTSANLTKAAGWVTLGFTAVVRVTHQVVRPLRSLTVRAANISG